jgi:large subunit ribosomal protein L19
LHIRNNELPLPPQNKQPLTVIKTLVTLPLRNVQKMDLIKIAQQAFLGEQKEYPNFRAGDTVTVAYRIVEGNKERLQKFKGVVIQRKGTGATRTFTVRKMSDNVGVERIFPITSPFIQSIEVNKTGKVRRARIFYMRKLTGKKARIKERKIFVKG